MAEANVTDNNNLPPEVLVKIFEHCDLNELVNIVDVCQLWRDVVIHQHMSGNDLVIRHPDDINNLISLLCKPVSFIKLHIVWDAPMDVDCSSVSLDALTNATSLTRLQSFMFDENVNEIIFYDCKLLDAFLSAILQTSTDTLTHLKLFYTSLEQFTDVKVVEVIEACQHLSHLVLNGCDLFNEHRLLDIIPTLTHLELLDLRETDVSHNLSFIAAVKRGCPNISNNIMIEMLDIRPSDDVNLLQFVSHVGILDIFEFGADQLRSLISCLNARVSQLSVDKLDVKKCDNHITDDILLSLVQPLHGLTELDASECYQLTNEGVVNVITSSPQLEEFEICGINNINRGIIQLLDRVVTKKNMNIAVRGTKLSEQMENNSDIWAYTGLNRNICLVYR